MHLLTPIYCYPIDGDFLDKEYHKYGFLYFEVYDYYFDQLNKFRKSWKKGKRDFETVKSILAGKVYLVKHDYVFDNCSKLIKNQYLVLDNLNLINTKLKLPKRKIIGVNGYWCYEFEKFYFEVPIYFRGNALPEVIFRSQPYSYFKLSKWINDI